MVKIYSMLEKFSQGPFIKEKIIEEFGITGRKQKSNLQTLASEKSEELAAVNGLILSGISCDKEGHAEWI